MSYHSRVSGRWRKTVRASEVSAWPSPPQGEILDTLHHDELSDLAESAFVGISDVEVVASYNWETNDSPKIIVPGKPPLWTPPVNAERLKEDDSKKNKYYRDRNAAYYPDHVLDPTALAIMKMKKTPTVKLDLFACGSTMSSLLRFVSGDDRGFRMLVQMVGETVHLIRRENSPLETIEGIRGYGHSFPEAYTMWESDVKKSKCHQRIIQYELGGIKTMLRYEGDGYLKNSTDEAAASPEVSDPVDTDSLADVLAAIAPSSDDVPYRNRKNLSLHVAEGGHAVDPQSIFDLKTRTIKISGRDILGEELPRLWIRQMTKFILAFHENGLFREENIKIEDVGVKIDEWEDENQTKLQKFMACLHWIMDRAREETSFELIFDGSDKLEVRDQLPDAKDPLSGKVRRQWEEWLGTATAEKESDGVGGSEEGYNDGEEAIIGATSDNWDRGDYGYRYDSSGGEEDWAFSDGEDDDEKDFTACDRECGYCGHCPY